jgi:hypothetical protein
MASGPPKYHMDRVGRRLADRSCNFVLAAEKRLGRLSLACLPQQCVPHWMQNVAKLPSYWAGPVIGLRGTALIVRRQLDKHAITYADYKVFDPLTMIRLFGCSSNYLV